MAQAIHDLPSRTRIVLIVDGHSDTRQMLRACLELGGFSVLEARTGAEAWDLAAESPPDLITTEMWLPGLDGYELCRRLRENVKTRSTPIVAYTSRCMPTDVQRALQVGCNLVLPKPSLPVELEAAIKRLLPVAA